MSASGSPAASRLADLAFTLLPQPIALISSQGKFLYTSPSFDSLFPEARTNPSSDPVIIDLLGRNEPGEPIRVVREAKTWKGFARVAPEEVGERVVLWVFENISGEAEAVRSRDEYLSTIVHDLRGPLAGIRGTLDFILEDPDVPLPEMHKELFRESRDEANRMMNLINEILDFSKIRAGRYQLGIERVNAAILVRRSVLSVRTMANREQITLESDVPKNIPAIAGNTDKLLQVLNNLLINAFKFTPSKGVIVVAAEARNGGPAGPRVLITVTDTGPGIPLEKQDELFSKFADVGTSTDKDIAGTGLGLFITKAIIEAYSGTITFASIPGIGTSFLMDLPAYQAVERSTAEQAFLPA